ncbi:MAG: hypothetical protein WCA80_09215, partial [Candidatus Aquilonibacter sp.]
HRTIHPSPIRALGPSGFPAALETNCRRDDGGVTYRFAIDEARLAAGFYTINVDATANPDVHRRNIRIYVAPQPKARPALRIGQRYLVVPVSNVVYADKNGATIPWSGISLHVARVTSIDAATVTLDVADTPYRLREARSGDSPVLLGLVPLVEDPSQQAMDSWYAGKEVWNRGQLLSLSTSDSNDLIDGKTGGGYDVGTIRVRHVYRVAMPFYGLVLGTRVGGSGFGNFYFESSSPLLVTLGVSDPRHVGATFIDRFSLFADSWDMQRALSTVSPHVAHPNWPRTVLEAIDEGRAQVGMTHEMVAWAIGFPPYEGSPSALYRLSDWDYEYSPRETYYVHFGADGRARSTGTFPGWIEDP